MSDSDEPFYSGSEEEAYYDSDGGDYTFEQVASPKQEPYKILHFPAVEEKMKLAARDVSSVLNLGNSQSLELLRLFKWDVSRCHEEWLSHQEKVRSDTGILEPPPGPPPPPEEEVECKICYEAYPRSEMLAAPCRHYFCKDCFGQQVSTRVSEGEGCLGLRCMNVDPKCRMLVPLELIREAAPEAHAQYIKFYVKNFVHQSRSLAWCPGPDCCNIAESTRPGAGHAALDVNCDCGHAYCFRCKEEAHRPLDCDTVRAWNMKNSSEAENMNWILANTKPCPHCKRPVEKNHGCMHMTCSQCQHHWCWLCGGDWKEHGERTGGFYQCNKFDETRKRGAESEDDRRRRNAKAHIERYSHYFERYDAHGKAAKKAKEESRRWQVSSPELERLSDEVQTPATQLRYVADAWAQVIECRRVLKWTYAYAFYAFDDAAVDQVMEKKALFEFLQGNAEGNLESLSSLLERDDAWLRKFAKEGCSPNETIRGKWRDAHRPGYEAWAGKVRNLTATVKKYFKELTDLLGNVDARSFHLAFELQQREAEEEAELARLAARQAGGGHNGPSTSAPPHPSDDEVMVADDEDDEDRAGPSGGNALRSPVRKKGRPSSGRAEGTRRSARLAKREEDQVLEVVGMWACGSCTFNNPRDVDECEVCGEARGREGASG